MDRTSPAQHIAITAVAALASATTLALSVLASLALCGGLA